MCWAGRVRKGLWARLSSLASTDVLTGPTRGSAVVRCELQQDPPGGRGKG